MKTLISLIALVFCTPLFAATYYVSYENGNNGYAGTERSKPLKDISFAVNTRSTGENDTIILLPGTFPLTAQISLKAGQTIIGETGNPEDVIIDCQEKCRAFDMQATAVNAMVASLTIINGKLSSSSGAGIRSVTPGFRSETPMEGSGYLHTISNCVFSGCKVNDFATSYFESPLGGAVHSRNGGLAIIGSLFTNCVASAGGAIGIDYWRNRAWGYENAPLKMKDCKFYNNMATNGVMTGVFNKTLGGGAICMLDDWLYSMSTKEDTMTTLSHGLILDDCIFKDNICSNGHGGAINGIVLSARNCDFFDNRSETSSASLEYCGGAWALNIIPNNKESYPYVRDTTNTFMNCRFERNHSSGFGGAFLTTAPCSLYFSDCTFDSNSANNDSPLFARYSLTSPYSAFHRCTFINHTNLSVTSARSYNANVCFLTKTDKGEFLDCVVSNNYCNGTGILTIGRNMIIDRCVFANNVLGNDQSVALSSGGRIAGSARDYRIQGVIKTYTYNIQGNSRIRNSLFVSNRCERTSGGAVALCDTNNKNYWIENNTFIGNGAAMRDEAVKTEFNSNSKYYSCALFVYIPNQYGIDAMRINNNLFHGNYDLDNPTAVQDIYCPYTKDTTLGRAVVSNCFFSVKATRDAIIENGTQNCVVGFDPKFVAADKGDWRIKSSSKASKSGLVLDWMENAYDLAGKSRKDGGYVAIGCYQPVFSGCAVIIR